MQKAKTDIDPTPLARAHDERSVKNMNHPDAQNMQQSYPSPTVMAADSSGPFYGASSSQPPAMSSSDELQLTASLGRGLAASINPVHGQAGNIMGRQEQAGEQGLNHQYDHAGQPHPHALEMRSPNEAMDQMGMQYGGTTDTSDSKKRSKVSRACDECRRKKIKCDAVGEEGTSNCSNCKRAGAVCRYGRVPLKRGPSKGYIKELADRLQNLEGAVHLQTGDAHVPQYGQQQPQINSPLPPRGSDEFAPPTQGDTGRKRSYSNVSGDPSPYQQQSRPQGWGPQEIPRQPTYAPTTSYSTSQQSQQAPTATMFREPGYSPNGMQPVPQWRNAPEPARRPSVSFDTPVQGEHDGDYAAEWDEGIINAYYALIHPTYPILHGVKENLRASLTGSSPLIKEAFHEALYAAIRSFPLNIMSTPLAKRGTSKAARLIATSLLESPSMRSFPRSNTIYLQIILLMAIEANNRGPTTDATTSGPQSVWLANAVGLAYEMKLHVHKTTPDRHGESDPDSEDKIARRLWWSLVIMDRWHSSSMSSPLLIPETTVIVYPSDEIVLGDATYHLARLSIVLGHFAAVDLVPDDLPPLAIPPVSLMTTLMRGELDRCRETFPPSVLSSPSLIHLAYWILLIQLRLRNPDTEPNDLLEPATDIVAHLNQHLSHYGPLTPHAISLAAATLVELSKFEDIKEKADNALHSLMDNRHNPVGWDTAIQNMIARKQRSSSSPTGEHPAGPHSALAAQGLRHLADLATATKETDESEKSPPAASAAHYRDLRKFVKGGYLASLLT